MKDLLRRGRFYLGFVVEKRGRDERPGRHEPILTDAEYRRTKTRSPLAPGPATSRPPSAPIRSVASSSAPAGHGCAVRPTSSEVASAVTTAARRSGAEVVLPMPTRSRLTSSPRSARQSSPPRS
jgi:hypothetical protein